MNNTLGMVHVDNLWADLNSHYNSGRIVVENLCIWDVRHTHQERLQRSWQVTTFHERTKRSWWGLNDDTTYWTETHTCSESYPVPLSGYFHAGTLQSGAEAGINEIFPHRDVPTEPTMENYLLYGGNINTGEGGMSMVVSNHLQTIPKVDTSLQHYSISRGNSFRGCFESGAIQRHGILVPAMVSEGPLQWDSHKTMSLQALHAKVTGKSQPLSFKARRSIAFPDFKIWQEEVPYFEKKGRATYLAKPLHEIGAAATFDNPHGHVEISSEESIIGIKPQINSLTQNIDAPAIELYQQILRQECQMELIDTGQVDPGILALVSLAASIASAGTLSPYILGVLGVKGTAAAAMVSAGVASLSSQAAVAMVANQGNIGQALKDLSSANALRSFAISIVSAGLTNGMGSEILPKNPTTLLEHAQAVAVRTTTSIALGTVIGGHKLEDVAKGSLINAAVEVGYGAIAREIGDAYHVGEMGPVLQKGLHFVGGAAAGIALNPDDPLRGAMSGGMGAALAEIFAEIMVDAEKIKAQVQEEAIQKGLALTPQDSKAKFEQKLHYQTEMARLAAGTVVLLAGQDVPTALFTGAIAVENNFTRSIMKDLAQAEGQGKVKQSKEKQKENSFLQKNYPKLMEGIDSIYEELNEKLKLYLSKEKIAEYATKAKEQVAIVYASFRENGAKVIEAWNQTIQCLADYLKGQTQQMVKEPRVQNIAVINPITVKAAELIFATISAGLTHLVIKDTLHKGNYKDSKENQQRMISQGLVNEASSAMPPDPDWEPGDHEKILAKENKDTISTKNYNIRDGQYMSENDALSAAEEFLGKGYKSLSNGRFVSNDGLRQVRMGDSDLMGLHGGRKHMHFEILKPHAQKSGKFIIEKNFHISLK
jgi:hypothetical protein